MHGESLPDFTTILRQVHPAAPSTSFLLGGRRAVAIGASDSGLQQLWLDGSLVLESLRVHAAHAELMDETPISIERVLRGDGVHLIERLFVPSDAPLCVIEWRVLGSRGTVQLSWHTPHATLHAQRAAAVIMVGDTAEAFFDCAPHGVDFSVAPAESNRHRVTAQLTVSPSDVIRLVLRTVGQNDVAPAVLARARLGTAARAAAEQIIVRTPDALTNTKFRWAQSQLPSLIATSAACPAAIALLACGDAGSARSLLRDPQKHSLEGDDVAALQARYFDWTGDACFVATLAMAASGDSSTAATSLPGRLPSATERAEAFVACVNGFMDSVLRIQPDAARQRLTLRPRLPAAWDSLEVARVRMGDALISFSYERVGDEHQVKVEQTEGAMPARLILELALPADSLAGASVDGHAATLDARRHGDRLQVPVQLVLDAPRQLHLTTRGGQDTKKIRPVRADSWS